MTRKLTKQQIDAEIQQIHLKSDDEIDFSDIPETTSKDWAEAERGKFYRPLKQVATVRLDKDVLAWLKEQGRGYQTRLNEILRKAMLEDTEHKKHA